MVEYNRTNLALLLIYASFTIGFFFNGANLQFYPTGTPLPKLPVCDLLSNFSRLCVPSVIVPGIGGIYTMNFDIIVLVLTLGSLLVATFILEKNQRRFAYS